MKNPVGQEVEQEPIPFTNWRKFPEAQLVQLLLLPEQLTQLEAQIWQTKEAVGK
jgi:hypothetical protein